MLQFPIFFRALRALGAYPLGWAPNVRTQDRPRCQPGPKTSGSGLTLVTIRGQICPDGGTKLPAYIRGSFKAPLPNDVHGYHLTRPAKKKEKKDTKRGTS